MRIIVERALRQNWERLFSYALRLSGNRDGAADLLQSCATKALAAAPPEEGERIRAWLFAILRNTWIDEHRRGVTGALAAEEAPEDESWRHDDRLIAAITVRQALERLDPLHREIVELVDLAGFRYGEAADILGVPVGTVMSRLSRARLSLLNAIEGGAIRPFAARQRKRASNT
ncbi:MAG: sigma-70 family RNA polymerase sigma factor [Bosea sp.]|uniref:RNA polymerase sigma factor n=1 Tax=Bosea sp. (in: a-proteobacteria) TaxID=1871050 RepID=UPI001AD378D7|nr:sigma-70 family RNA polymerase sigma factor [Bosea sp. (in: a-proteobacteria)]MBN9452091.1 sigma-70 family RNA polymerase sigma factor [Bosea sp. (in: a-proteobacteria)]